LEPLYPVIYLDAMIVKVKDGGHTRNKAAHIAVAKRLGVSYESLRRWVNQAEVDTGVRDGVPTDTVRELRELKRKNRELEETIEILKAATSFFVRESDPRHH